MATKQHARPPRRAILFFPANRPERFSKAVATGADCICIDLEDAVGPDEKDAGRTAMVGMLAGAALPPAEIIVRVNDVRTEAGERDMLALTQLERAPDAVMIPKVDSPNELRRLGSLLDAHRHITVIALIETALGLEYVADIARSSTRLSALLLGGVDLSSELGCAIEWDALLYARSRIVHAAVLGGLDAIDTPSLNVANPAAVAAEARAVARLGFVGKAVIHPAQVQVVQAAFAPDADEVQYAHQVVAAYAASNGDAVMLDGQVIERPVLKSAQRTLALHTELAQRQTHARERRL